MDIFLPLKNADFRWLFMGQLFSLLGTGLTTVALALLAYDLEPTAAGMVLGTALAVKMIAYLGVAPVVGGYASQLPRRSWLVGLCIARALLVALLPFATGLVQFFVLMFFLNSMAAGYTPIYQALLPDILPEEKSYTQALSLSRLAMEIESLLSPALAAVLLLVVQSNWLFWFNSAGFLSAALLLLLVQMPASKKADRSGGVWQHISFGVKSYLKTPRLRAVLLCNLALSAAGAMVIVNTVVYVRAILGLPEQQVPLLMLAAGVGSMVLALILPKLLQLYTERNLMLSGGVLLGIALFAGVVEPTYVALFPIWFLIGAGTSLILIPTGVIIRNSCHAADRNDYFSANFALTHGMWLLGYLLAAWLGDTWGMSVTFVVLSLVSLLATALAAFIWRSDENMQLWHEHQAMEHLHLHWHDEHHQHEHQGWEGDEPHAHPHYHASYRHQHIFIIDEHHLRWPI